MKLPDPAYGAGLAGHALVKRTEIVLKISSDYPVYDSKVITKWPYTYIPSFSPTKITTTSVRLGLLARVT